MRGRRRRHGVLLSALSLAVISPVLISLSEPAGWSVVRIPLPAAEAGPTRHAPAEHPAEAAETATHVAPAGTAATGADAPSSPHEGADGVAEKPAPREQSPSNHPGDAVVAGKETATADAISNSPFTADSAVNRDADRLPVWRVIGTLAACLWGAGTLIAFALFVRGLLVIRRLRNSLALPNGPRPARLLAEAFRQIGAKRNVPICESRLASSPLSLGLLRPAVVLPEGLADELDDDQLRCVLVHEAAHLIRRDHWIGLLACLGSALFWWNPLVRAVNAGLSRLREEICDDYVLCSTGEGRQFAEVLVHVAGWNGAARLAAPYAPALVDDGVRDLEDRITRLVHKERPMTTRMNRTTIAAVAAFSLLLSAVLLIPALRADERNVGQDAGSAAKPAINNVAVDASRAVVKGALDGGTELHVWIGEERDGIGWTSYGPRPVRFEAVIESSDEIKLDDGSRGHGFVVKVKKPGTTSTAYIHIGGDDFIPGGRFKLRDRHTLKEKDGTSTFADIERPDGKQIPVSVRIRKRPARGRTATASAESADRDGASRPEKPAAKSPDLSGRWLLSLPAGAEHRMTFSSIGENRYRLDPGRLNSSGVYELRGSRLIITESNDPRLTGFEWRVQSPNILVLVGQPPAGRTGANYLGAVMTRLDADGKPVELKRPSPDLSGRWRLNLPAGFEHKVTLKWVGRNWYALHPNGLNGSGIYERRDDRLVIVLPTDPRLTGFEWQVLDSGSLVLTGQPPSAKTGANYLADTDDPFGNTVCGATLTRLGDGDDSEPAKQRDE